MLTLNSDLIPHLSGILIYLILIVVTIRQRGGRDSVSRWLSAYLGVSLIFEFAGLLLITEPYWFSLGAFLNNLTLYKNLIRIFLLLHLSVLFFRRRPARVWWLLGGIFFSMMVVLDFILTSSPFLIKFVPYDEITGHWILTTSVIIIWGVYASRILWRTFRSFRRDQFIITKPRIVYWFLGLSLLIGGDILFFLQLSKLGSTAQIMGTIVISYIVLTTRLPDIKGVFQRLLFAFFSASFELIIYVVGILLFYVYTGELISYRTTILSFVLALLFLFLFNPFLRLVKNWLRRIFFGREWKDHQVLREFSKSISSVLDLNLLSRVVLERIGDWIDVNSGTLFTVESDQGVSTEPGYQIVNVQKSMNGIHPPGIISTTSPIAFSFGKERKSLTISDIEMSPRYQSSGAGELNWFKNQQLALFVPILSMDEWIGLLALGPKTSGASFTRSDLHLVELIADQIAVGLQNARLVESLVRVNKEFKKAYSAMEEANIRLEQLDLTKLDFIGVTSHELRTPLTVISGYSEMLKQDPIYQENDYYQKVIGGIFDSTARLRDTVDTLLDIIKIDGRSLVLKKEPVEVNVLLQKIYSRLQDSINERNLILSFENLDDLPVLSADPEELEKVFYHLISNAVKFTPDGGKIAVFGSFILGEDDETHTGNVQIVVCDSGIGIDKRYEDFIFTKFVRTGEKTMYSPGNTKFKGSGPGLGLAVVKGIVEAHGGRVWVESPGCDEDKLPGSKFFVNLPI
jgi:signal transduction histidine kinase